MRSLKVWANPNMSRESSWSSLGDPAAPVTAKSLPSSSASAEPVGRASSVDRFCLAAQVGSESVAVPNSLFGTWQCWQLQRTVPHCAQRQAD
jgi:hypothetical protein